jgi:heat shock protein beta
METSLTFRKVILSNRLVKSPCAVIADTGGYTANVAKLMGKFPYSIKVFTT